MFYELDLKIFAETFRFQRLVGSVTKSSFLSSLFHLLAISLSSTNGSFLRIPTCTEYALHQFALGCRCAVLITAWPLVAPHPSRGPPDNLGPLTTLRSPYQRKSVRNCSDRVPIPSVLATGHGVPQGTPPTRFCTLPFPQFFTAWLPPPPPPRSCP